MNEKDLIEAGLAFAVAVVVGGSVALTTIGVSYLLEWWLS